MTKSEDPNPTVVKFGHPETVVAEYPHWLVLLRLRQATLGALVLAHKGTATALAEVEAAAFAELTWVTGDIERGLNDSVGFDKLNYLALMMVDPYVHFHVLPRYAAAKTFAGHEFADAGWPGAPDLASGPTVTGALLVSLRDHLRQCWPEGV